MRFPKYGLGGLCIILVACNPAPSTQKEQDYLQEQGQQQGYPTLIAIPTIAEYALPFCEKEYCIDIEIFSFKSQDQWFNQYVEQQIADQIRQRLGLKQKLSLQRAINEYIALSDSWVEESNAHKPWSMYIKPRIAMQQEAIALLVMHSEYDLRNQHIPEQDYFYVVDRKAQKAIRLYDLVKASQRVDFSQMIQQQYQQWQIPLAADQKLKLAEKLYWANQDWFFDEQGIAIYYRAEDLGIERAENLIIYLTPEQMEKWIKSEYLLALNLRG